MTVDYEEMVRKFMRKHKLEPRRDLIIPKPEIAVLRLRLMMEELGEVASAIHQVQSLEGLVDGHDYAEAFILLADGLADLIYVVVGTAIAYGIPINEVFAEVHRSNMTKVGLSATQKGGKDSTFEEPRIWEILEPKLA